MFANDLDPAKRSDRVIAEEWDATFTLFDGVPTEEDIARLKENVPKQEVGRISERELSLSRANRSVRLFDAVRHELAAGRQPDAELLNSVGYLMRTTAVSGLVNLERLTGASSMIVLNSQNHFNLSYCRYT